MENIQKRIAGLSNKQVCSIIKHLVQDVAVADPSRVTPDTLAGEIGQISSDGGMPIKVDGSREWSALELSPDASGDVGRLLLLALVEQPGTAGFVAQAVDRYSMDPTLDLGILSGGVVVTMLWLAIVTEIKMDVGAVHIHKRGISAADQARILQGVLNKIPVGWRWTSATP